MRLVFQKMVHGTSKYGEYLLLVFQAEERDKNAYFLLSPVTNPEVFAENFVALTGQGHDEYKPTPEELETFCAREHYDGEVVEKHGILQVVHLRRHTAGD